MVKHINGQNETFKVATTLSHKEVQIEGNREINRVVKLYNLDMIETIYSKTKSQSGYDFIKWANELISNYKKNIHTEYSLMKS